MVVAPGLRYLVCFLPSVFVLTGNLLGSWWAASNMVFTLGLLVIADFIIGKNKSQTHPSQITQDLILYTACFIHWLSAGTLLYGIGAGILKGQTLVFASVSTGLNAGLIGITSAHELIHRKSLFQKRLGLINLTLCLYLHFYIEHRLGHHARVGTNEDPATARKGESFYRFFFRTVPGQWISAWKLETSRLNRIRLSFWSNTNFMLWATVLQTAMVLGLWIFAPDGMLQGFVIQAFVAIFLLEYVNYIEHYGLSRKKGEPVLATHAWQSESASSRFNLFELSLHSHHHMDAKVPYGNLHWVESECELPYGYFGMFYIALIPPLWFYMMDSRIPSQKTSPQSNYAPDIKSA